MLDVKRAVRYDVIKKMNGLQNMVSEHWQELGCSWESVAEVLGVSQQAIISTEKV